MSSPRNELSSLAIKSTFVFLIIRALTVERDGFMQYMALGLCIDRAKPCGQ